MQTPRTTRSGRSTGAAGRAAANSSFTSPVGLAPHNLATSSIQRPTSPRTARANEGAVRQDGPIKPDTYRTSPFNVIASAMRGAIVLLEECCRRGGDNRDIDGEEMMLKYKTAQSPRTAITAGVIGVFLCGVVSGAPNGDPEALPSKKVIERTVDEIVQDVNADNPQTRRRALRLLGERKERRASHVIRQHMLSDVDWRVRQEAIVAAGKLVDVDDSSTLREVMQRDSNRNNRIAAVRVFSKLEGKQAVSLLRTQLRDEDKLFALSAARELGRYGVTEGNAMARKLLQDRNWLLRAAAADALSTAGDPDCIPDLEKLLVNPKEHRKVQFSARIAVLSIRLAKLQKKEGLTFLGENLRGESWAARRWAAKMLIVMGDKDSQAVLSEAAADASHPGNLEARQALAHSKRQ